jgi:hypothetical protein
MRHHPTSTRRALTRVLLLAGTAAASVWGMACRGPFEGRAELRAQKVALEREVEGLRTTVARLERHETLLPPNDVVVAVADTLIRDVIAAQLPFDADVEQYKVHLVKVDVIVEASQVVRLRGSLFVRDNPALAADVSAVGVLEKIVIDGASSTLTARIALDHIGIDKVSGLESILNEAALDELARLARDQIANQLPVIQIPVKVQQTIEFPYAEVGPFRLAAASLPLQASVSQVVAGRGRIWIAIRIIPGEFVKAAPVARATSPVKPGRLR